MLGIITQVSGRGTAVMSSYAAALGLDAPVEVRRTPPFPAFPTTFSQSIREQASNGRVVRLMDGAASSQSVVGGIHEVNLRCCMLLDPC